MNTPEFHRPSEDHLAGVWPRPTPDRRIDDERRAADRRHTERRSSRAVTALTGAPIAEDDRAGFPLTPIQLEHYVRSALHESGAFHDLMTVACVRSTRRAHGTIVARQDGIAAGVPLAITAFRLLDPNIAIRVDAEDGDRVRTGTVVMRIVGLARAMLSAERVGLDFLQRLSGVATLAARYARAVHGTRATVVEAPVNASTRHRLECYALRVGSGIDRDRAERPQPVRVRRHHIAALRGDVASAVRCARGFAPADVQVAVECSTVDQARAAVAAGADILELHHMSAAQASECVAAAEGRALTEIRGPLSLDAARTFAGAGIHHIDIAPLVERAPGLDLALDFEAV